jgi:hypothetical protein
LLIPKFGFTTSYTKNFHGLAQTQKPGEGKGKYLPIGLLGKPSKFTINIKELCFQLLHKKIHCIAIITRLVQPRAKFQGIQ